MSGNSNTAANGTFYAGFISGSGTGPYVVGLYSDSQMQTPVDSTTTSGGGGGTGNIPTTLVAEITGGSGSTFTLGTAATFGVSSALWTIGNDDTAAIAEAVAAVAASGGVLYFPQGNYFIAAPATSGVGAAITIGTSGVTVRGDGPGVSVITKAYEAGNVLSVSGAFFRTSRSAAWALPTAARSPSAVAWPISASRCKGRIHRA